ncbi:hypothetical protein [Actinoplanes sp. CA-252034]|uniref:hypothetical protein n=1 Tax=Actinoplanes sp. CA-252034 TaxID=3239906 RepID=UPI003D997D43
MTSGTAWTSTDAWLLMALGGTSEDDPSPLSEIINRADAIEHAVMEEAEFTTSAGRLTAAGLIAGGGGDWWLTAAGQELYADRTRRSGWRDNLLRGLRKLGAPQDAPLTLEPGEFAKAVGR